MNTTIPLRFPIGLLFALLFTVPSDAAQIDFQKQVMPILQQHCVSCHNDRDKKGDLSLLTAHAMLKGGESGKVIEPGEPDTSYLLDLLQPNEGTAEMPKGKAPLSQQQRTILRNWIAEGATWPNDVAIPQPVWWSFKPLVQPAVPPFQSTPATTGFEPLNAIDHFVARQWLKRDLRPVGQADRRTLIRRLYFDLTGLPPTPEEVHAFVNNKSADAYEQLVDRLLASSAYGERWARHWLDVVKYADTCGYDKDKLRPNAFPYRDFVIRSFNDDKPYWRFVQEQIAGDALFPDTADGIIGLGFIAAGPWDFIGHVEVPAEKIDGKVARNIDRDEMVTNTLNTFNSVTIQCARCHDHKFDPYTQKHYYQLQAVFAAVDRAERRYDSDLQTEQERKQLNQRLAELRAEKKTNQDEIAKLGGAPLKALNERIAKLDSQNKLAGKAPEFGYHSNISLQQEKSKWVQVDLGQPRKLTRFALRPCHDEFGGIGAGFGFPVRFKIEACDKPDFSDGVTLIASETDRDFQNPGLSAYQVDHAATARYLRVTASKLAPRSNDFIFAVAELELYDQDGKNVALGTTVTSFDSIQAPVRWARSNLVDGKYAQAVDPQISKQLVTARAKLAQLLAKIDTPERQNKLQQLASQIKTTQDQIAKLPAGKMVYAAATNFNPQGNFKPTGGKPRQIHLLERGNVLSHGEEVRAGTLPLWENESEVFDLPPTAEESQRRAALAKWLTRQDHLLTWRSIVNRVWHYHFGQGLCSTPNDFGRMGAEPTHPELLDWLACDFRDNGQSFKRLHKLIVMSRIYQLDSSSQEKNEVTDRGNNYLWRANRRRLEAEEIRDSILQVSGKLDRTMYGPGYFLFALEKTAHSPHFEYHKHDPNDPKSHRRSVYRFIARSQPDPFMTTLDCADSSQSTPSRNETLTSLQALALLNNGFNTTMASHFATRLKGEATETPDQVSRGFALVTGRQPSNNELKQLTAYTNEHGLPNLCRLLLNLSEFVYVD